MDRITIPGPFTFWHTHDVPPVEVRLPVVASASLPSLLITGSLFALGAAMWLSTLTALLWSIATHRHSSLAVTAPFSLLNAAFGVGCVLLTLRCVRLAIFRNNQLTITADEVIDRRQDARVAWTNVRHMSVRTGRQGWHTMQLELHQPVQHRGSLLDLPPRLPGVRTSNRILIGIRMLDERPYVLVHTMAMLVRKHGGTTAEITRWGWDQRL